MQQTVFDGIEVDHFQRAIFLEADAALQQVTDLFRRPHRLPASPRLLPQIAGARRAAVWRRIQHLLTRVSEFMEITGRTGVAGPLFGTGRIAEPGFKRLPGPHVDATGRGDNPVDDVRELRILQTGRAQLGELAQLSLDVLGHGFEWSTIEFDTIVAGGVEQSVDLGLGWGRDVLPG